MRPKINKSLLLFFFIAIFLSNNSVNIAQDRLIERARSLSYQGFIKHDANLFKKSIGLCERLMSANPENHMAKYFTAYNQYRLLLIPGNDENYFNTYFESAIKYAKMIDGNSSLKSEAKALLAAIYMMRLAKDQSEAQAISSKIYVLLDEAKNLNPVNPRIYLVKGIMQFHTPKMFGGSIKNALNNFNKAIEMYEGEDNNTISWGYLESLAWKGQALTKQGKYRDAEKIYEKALKAEPKFGWVNYKLLPALKKMESNSIHKIIRDSSKTAQINILIKGLDNNEGTVRIALNNSEKNYNSGKPFRSCIAKIKGDSVKYSFGNIPYGSYAIKFYHDENGNKKLDKNILGIPSEEYGFSNNAKGSFGPALFKDAKFSVNKNIINVKMTVQ